MPLDEKRRRLMENVAIVTISMPDGSECDVPLYPKTYKSGREGYYAQVPTIKCKGKSYGGQIMLYERDSGRAIPTEDV